MGNFKYLWLVLEADRTLIVTGSHRRRRTAGLHRINPDESGLSSRHAIICRSVLARCRRTRPERIPQEDQLAEINTDVTRHAWLNRKRAAAVGVGLGATLVLAPFVWAENPPMASDP